MYFRCKTCRIKSCFTSNVFWSQPKVEAIGENWLIEKRNLMSPKQPTDVHSTHGRRPCRFTNDAKNSHLFSDPLILAWVRSVSGSGNATDAKFWNFQRSWSCMNPACEGERVLNSWVSSHASMVHPELILLPLIVHRSIVQTFALIPKSVSGFNVLLSMENIHRVSCWRRDGGYPSDTFSVAYAHQHAKLPISNLIQISAKVVRWQNLVPSFPWIALGWRAWGAIQGKEGINFCSVS